MSLSRGSLSRGVSVWGSLSRESLSGGLCPGEGISVQGVYAEGGLLSRGSLVVSVQEGLYQGVPVHRVSI